MTCGAFYSEFLVLLGCCVGVLLLQIQPVDCECCEAKVNIKDEDGFLYLTYSGENTFGDLITF